jgi:hypothetical protein
MKLPKQLLTCILFTALFLSLFSSLVNCQIKIKEKVGINPQKLSLKRTLSNIDIEAYLRDSVYIPPVGVFPQLSIIKNWLLEPGIVFTDFDAYFGQNMWFDFCAYHDYNRINIIQGAEYARINVGNYPALQYCYSCYQTDLRAGYADVLNNTSSFTDAGDNFKTYNSPDYHYIPFWISFDKKPPPAGSTTIQIQMIHDHISPGDWSPYPDSVVYSFTLFRPTSPHVNASATPDKIFQFQKNDIMMWIEGGSWTDSTNYNASIIHGTEFGDLYDPTTNTTGKAINNIGYSNGQIFFIPQDIGNVVNDSVVISITATNSKFASTTLVLPIKQEKLQVTFVPSVISAGDVANIIVKKKNDDGSLSDLSSDQLFNVRIVDGVDYGAILVPGYSDSTTERWYIPQGFSFYAKKQIPSPSVQAAVYVETAQGGAESIKPGLPLVKANQSTKQKSFITQSILQKNNSLKSNPIKLPITNYKSSSVKSVKQINSVNNIQDDGTLFGTGTVTINSEGLLVTFDKPSFSPGDTLNVIIKKVDVYGNETDYPDTTQFEVGIESGCDLGVILNTVKDSTAQYFSKIRQPIKFIAYKSYNKDSVVVLIVGAPKIVDNQILSKISPGKSEIKSQGNLKGFNSTSMQSLKKVKKITGSGPGQECLFFQMLHSIIGTASATKNKQFKLEIIYPLASSPNDSITCEPKMPIVKCKAMLHNYSGNIIFHWEYWLSSNIKRSDVDGSDLCTRICQTEIIGRSLSKDSIITEWIVPFSVNNLKKFSLSATVPSRPHFPKYGGNCGSNISTWQDEGNDVFTGGNVWVKVSAYNAADSTKLLGVDTLSANNVLGLNSDGRPSNPTQAMIMNSALSKELKAIMTVESRKIHFYSSGFPNFGGPNGFGLMQIDNYMTNKMQVGPSEMEMWNWKSNIQRAQIIYNTKINDATTYLNKLISVPSDDQIRMEAFSRYNGYFYYKNKYNENTGGYDLIRFPKEHFKLSNDIDQPYAEKAMDVYNNE